ncbi:Coiled-coil domain-containing protein KIAA1407 [Habropoda laboriosa]|uniref:Coiled-coil domain-containing protein KIAA1407 n=1 Tax=Habropoda laboriosa TaxID=597456 RepID=A0A0L7RDZ8_9HYME|nr:Coiled-coil domain-containing protein KIAA1407 [Habropoda laboriosa]
MNDVTNLMDKMMKVDIFHPSEKLRMLKDEDKTFLDPNIIMDTRHRILRENLSVSPAKASVFAEAKKLLTQEETTQSYMKKQQRFLERELKRFEMELSKSRPKFSKAYTCKRGGNFAPSDDEEFWRTSRKLRNKVDMSFSIKNSLQNISNERTELFRKKTTVTETNESSLKAEVGRSKEEAEWEGIGSIKVTIKDKTNVTTETQRLLLLRKYFDVLKENAREERRFREIRTKIRQSTVSKITRKYFDIWRMRARDARDNAEKRKEEPEVIEERRIEMFINAITERQREMMKSQKSRTKDSCPMVKEWNKPDTRKKSTYCKRIIVESPAQSRLNAQKQIIERQKVKLAEQNRIIEELKLKQMQKDISRANKETVDIAKETLNHFGQKTRRTLIQLMQQNGYRDESFTIPQLASDPPKFLLRVEARAEARRRRVKLAEEIRREKQEEQKRKEEAARMEEEQKKRRLQQEALAEVRRLRKEQERKRQCETEMFQRLNNLADEFYRKYLLRRYIMEPFAMLLEEKKYNMKKAEDHYREKLTRKIFATWRNETEIRCKTRVEIAESFCNGNLTTRMFKEWRQMAKEVNLKHQVAMDFHDMKVLDKYFKRWRITTLELKAKSEEERKLADGIYENKLKARYFGLWKKYLVIAEDIKESEKRKDELRQLVQKVIPDFDPKQRGVALED